MDLISIKNAVIGGLGVLLGVITNLLGGWDKALEGLLACMAVDFVSGLIVASVFHNSPKTPNGGLCSEESRKGLCKKCMMLLFVMIGYELERMTGSGFIRDSVIYGFIANEILSITENASLMGIPLPSAIADAIEVLKHKSDKKGDEDK